MGRYWNAENPNAVQKIPCMFWRPINTRRIVRLVSLDDTMNSDRYVGCSLPILCDKLTGEGNKHKAI